MGHNVYVFPINAKAFTEQMTFIFQDKRFVFMQKLTSFKNFSLFYQANLYSFLYGFCDDGGVDDDLPDEYAGRIFET